MELPGVATQLQAIRAASSAAVSADMAAQRAFAALDSTSTPDDAAQEMILAFSASTDAVEQASEAAARALATLVGLVNQKFRYEKKQGRR